MPLEGGHTRTTDTYLDRGNIKPLRYPSAPEQESSTSVDQRRFGLNSHALGEPMDKRSTLTSATRRSRRWAAVSPRGRDGVHKGPRRHSAPCWHRTPTPGVLRAAVLAMDLAWPVRRGNPAIAAVLAVLRPITTRPVLLDAGLAVATASTYGPRPAPRRPR